MFDLFLRRFPRACLWVTEITGINFARSIHNTFNDKQVSVGQAKGKKLWENLQFV